MKERNSIVNVHIHTANKPNQTKPKQEKRREENNILLPIFLVLYSEKPAQTSVS